MHQSFSFLKASTTPVEDISLLTYEGQDPSRRLYKSGYEHYLNQMPILRDGDDLLGSKVALTQSIMKELTDKIISDGWVEKENVPEAGGFNRTIIAIESPLVDSSSTLDRLSVKKQGSELVVARWGDGFSSPVHGHAAGYIHEEILFGKIRVNSYRIVDDARDVVRPVKTTIEGRGTLASAYAESQPDGKRRALVHNFTSIGNSGTLHYLPEHTRDGRDNRFSVEFFENVIGLTAEDVSRITSKEGMYLRKGDVVLVRSSNVPEYGDHFIVVTGHPVMKEHGLRVQDEAIQASAKGTELLNQYEDIQGLTLLKLRPEAAKSFLDFHAIELVDGEVIFPNA